MAISRSLQPRQQYGLGSFVKKFTKPIKKIVKSPLGKAALIGGLGWGANAGIFGGLGKGWLTGKNAGLLTRLRSGKNFLGGVGNLFRKDDGTFSYGKMLLGGLGAAGMALPFMGGKDEEEETDTAWWQTPDSISNIHEMAKNRDSSLKFLPSSIYADSNYYNMAQGGIVGLANGGEAGQAQAEQMLRAEYQKYRNQGGTMSYQQFKMAVLQQAQQQGPVAQAANGGRIGYAFGKGPILDPDTQEGPISPFQIQQEEGVPMGLSASNAENVEEVQGEPSREQLEALAMEIFQLRLEELDEEQLMVVYQAAMQQQPEAVSEDVEYARDGGRIGYRRGRVVHPGGYSGEDWGDDGREDLARRLFGKSVKELLPDQLRELENEVERLMNKFRANGGRIRAEEGGIMDLGGMEKDYRQEGGFVPLGEEEKADDVPARLSKNEFVFTADAVRAAGGGDIDQGAEVMENIMENLEAGGEISEESQGQGAQGMYDNMKQLETRIA
jgi:hypothetical protein